MSTAPHDARRRETNVVGAGPAGLTAAITLATRGARVVVHERHKSVGQRFHGDFQGLENWTTSIDVMDELAEWGIEPNFEHVPFSECTVFDPFGKRHTYRSARPLWYLVRRGDLEGSLDHGLEATARAHGVEIRLNSSMEHLPDGGIVAHGPRRADAIAVGYVFKTTNPDGAFAALSDSLAPQGYSYLLISNGRGTVASCMFGDFHNERQYLERTVEYFRDRVGFTMDERRRFGGFGNIFPERLARRDRLLYAGEAAGFQDALFGFGMRHAMVSGYLAARAWLTGQPEHYDTAIRERLGGLLRMAMVNRFLFERLGNRGYTKLLKRIGRAPDVRNRLRRFYGSSWWTFAFYRHAIRTRELRRRLIEDCPEGCDCTWCRCQHRSPGAPETSST